MAIYINQSGTAKRMDGAGDGSLYAPVTSIATPENGSTASKAYAVGEMFIRDGKLCTCTVAISSGGTFALGTNYSEGSVGEVLSELNSKLSANSLGPEVDITNYVFGSNDYICPYDGIFCAAANGDNTFSIGYVNNIVMVSVYGTAAAMYGRSSVYVKKGQFLAAHPEMTGGFLTFIPYL